MGVCGGIGAERLRAPCLLQGSWAGASGNVGGAGRDHTALRAAILRRCRQTRGCGGQAGDLLLVLLAEVAVMGGLGAVALEERLEEAWGLVGCARIELAE